MKSEERRDDWNEGCDCAELALMGSVKKTTGVEDAVAGHNETYL